MKINISLPDAVLKKADEKAGQLGLSRSAFIAMAISEKVRQDEMMDMLPQMIEQMKNASSNMGK